MFKPVTIEFSNHHLLSLVKYQKDVHDQSPESNAENIRRITLIILEDI